MSDSSDSSSSAEEEMVAVPKLKTSSTIFLGDADKRESDPHSQFDLSHQEIASVWLARLGTSNALPCDLSSVPLEEANQRVIRYDCERTRATMEEFRAPETRLAMERLLTYYCHSHRLKYKQGMNEVLAPFVYLKLVGALHTWQQVYGLYAAFIDLFLPYMFSDEEFLFLQRSCLLFRTCLRYHAPSLSSRLDAGFVTPEMYVTPWFLTMFSSKTSLHAVFHLWHILITQGDRHSFIFVSCSLCISHARLLRAAPKSSLPETITKISITPEAVMGMWKRGVKIRQHTPPMFTQQLINAGESGRIDPLNNVHLEKQLGVEVYPMLVRPMDLFRAKQGGWTYVVLDCRNFSDRASGSLPLAIPFDLEALVANQNVFPVAEALNRVAKLMGVDISQQVPQWPLDHHLCLMGLSDLTVDAIGLMYLALSKFSNVPRLSILQGGFLALHTDVPQELIDHDTATCPLCNHSGSSESSVSSPSGASVMQRLKSFVSSSKLFVGTNSPIPTTVHVFVPHNCVVFFKCRLKEIIGRTPSSDLEANALLVIEPSCIRCLAAPLDMTLLTAKCELRMYGTWKLLDLCKITSRASQESSLFLYFSVEAAPDLVVSLINAKIAKAVVGEVRKQYRLARQAPK